MIDNQQLHKAQISILDMLRHTEEARFSDLMQPTGLTSDAFKFHIRKLAQAGVAEKTSDRTYRLTAYGKEIANTINRETRAAQKQPKQSVMVIISRTTDKGDIEYLLQQRLRNPFYHYWSFITGPIRWGEEPEAVAARELAKQTGLQATLAVSGFYRERTYDKVTGELLADTFFTVMTVHGTIAGTLRAWESGQSAWMTIRELEAQEKYFTSYREILSIPEQNIAYVSRTTSVSPNSY